MVYDVREVKLKSLRDQIGVVLQEPFLFNGTLAEKHRLRETGGLYEGDYGCG